MKLFVRIIFLSYLSWLCAFSLDCFWYGVKGREDVMSQNKNDLPPYPGREFNNIFWFIQVHQTTTFNINSEQLFKDLICFYLDF